MGCSHSDLELYDRPLEEYGVDGPTLADICESDHGINSGLCNQLSWRDFSVGKELH
jgi:hypothetical protein